jgi:hypothetical protein
MYSHILLEGFVSAIILMRIIFHGVTLIIHMIVSCKLMRWPVGDTKGYDLFYRFRRNIQKVHVNQIFWLSLVRITLSNNKDYTKYCV